MSIHQAEQGQPDRQRTVLGILGMHRSGTSALTGLLSKVGVDLGDSMRMPHPGVNAKGYWEHLGVVYTHDDLLHDLHSSWDDPRALPDHWEESPAVRSHREALAAIIRRDFAHRDVWGIKDPRMCRLLPLWRNLFDEFGMRPTWVLTGRHPAEVARSLQRRDGFPTEKSGLLWLIHQLDAEAETRSDSRVFLDFRNVLSDPLGTLDRIEKTMGRPFPVSPDEAMSAVRDFISPDLRHHRADGTDYAEFGPWADLVQATVTAWEAAVVNGEDDALRREFTAIRVELRNRQRALDESLAGHIDTLYRRIADSRREIETIRRAPSWHLTKPLRLAERTVVRVARGLRGLRRDDSSVPDSDTLTA